MSSVVLGLSPFRLTSPLGLVIQCVASNWNSQMAAMFFFLSLATYGHGCVGVTQYCVGTVLMSSIVPPFIRGASPDLCFRAPWGATCFRARMVIIFFSSSHAA